MVKQFPQLIFTYSFREDGNRFAGIYYGENGEITTYEEAGTSEDTDDNYKLFLNKHFGDTLYQCEECEHLMEYWEYSQEYACTECQSKDVKDYN